MTTTAEVAYLRQIWRDLARKASANVHDNADEWDAVDQAANKYDQARDTIEVARLRNVWQATYDQFDRDDAYNAYMTAQIDLKERIDNPK